MANDDCASNSDDSGGVEGGGAELELVLRDSSPDFSYSVEAEPFAQGAEARLYRAVFLGRPAIVKHRFPKKYRNPVLDESLTTTRMRSEIRCIARCAAAGLAVPAIFHVDIRNGLIVMQRIEDVITLRQYFNESLGKGHCYSEETSKITALIGQMLAGLHRENIIHGDLTTSNMLLKLRNEQQSSDSSVDDHASSPLPQQQLQSPQVVLIDFGLSSVSTLVEDKGVDLYVLEKSFLATHPNSELLFDQILQSYEENFKGATVVLRKLCEVRQRGRKREMIG